MSTRIPLSACLLTFTLAAAFGASTHAGAPAAGAPRYAAGMKGTLVIK